MMRMTNVTELDTALTKQITELSTITDETLLALEQTIERAYVHVLIERALRSATPAQPSRVSQLAQRLRRV